MSDAHSEAKQADDEEETETEEHADHPESSWLSQNLVELTDGGFVIVATVINRTKPFPSEIVMQKKYPCHNGRKYSKMTRKGYKSRPEKICIQSNANGPQVHVTTPRRSKQNGVQIVEVTKCCSIFKCFPCLRGFRIWLVRDACGYVCAGMTWSLILYALFVVFLLLYNAEFGYVFNVANGLVYTFFALLAGASHLKAMTTDPGAIPIGNATPANIQRMGLKENQVVYKCAKCCSIKPERSHHCSVCQRCVRKMDHHCPWINNCVGENNQKFFVLFNLYVAVISLHVMFLVTILFVDCLSITSEARTSRPRSSGQLFKDVRHHGVNAFFRARPPLAVSANETLDGHDIRDPVCGAFSRPLYVILVILVVFEALLFSIFTTVMCLSQLCSICKDETGIEALKNEGGNWGRKSHWTNVKSVFGSPFSAKWFSPFHMPNTNMGKLEPYQYCV